MKAISLLSVTACLAVCACDGLPEANHAMQDASEPAGSASAGQGVDTAPRSVAARVEVQTMSPDIAIARGIEGCGTALRLKDAGAGNDNYVWFDNFQKGVVKLNGQVVVLTASDNQASTGAENFANSDAGVTVSHKLTRGAQRDSEVFDVSGTLSIRQGGTTVDLPVEGDVGC